jgi:hypothetical protein
VSTKRLQVSIPITGVYFAEITVPTDATDDEIYEAAIAAHDADNNATDVTWEFTHRVTSGNVCHAMLNSWSFEEIKNESA